MIRFSQKTYYFRIALNPHFQFEFLCEEIFWEKFDYNASPYFRVKTVVKKFHCGRSLKIVFKIQFINDFITLNRVANTKNQFRVFKKVKTIFFSSFLF